MTLHIYHTPKYVHSESSSYFHEIFVDLEVILSTTLSEIPQNTHQGSPELPLYVPMQPGRR